MSAQNHARSTPVEHQHHETLPETQRQTMGCRSTNLPHGLTTKH